MFWFNGLLFGVILGLLAAWLWYEDEHITLAGCTTVVSVIYGFGYFVSGILFLTHNNTNSIKQCMADSDCEIVYMFTRSQAMINSLSPEVQAYLGVEEKFCIESIIMCIILIIAIVFVILKINDVGYLFEDDYKSFNHPNYREIAIPYKFKIFKKVYESLSISKTNPFISINKHNLVYLDNTEYKRYRLQFSYIDYLKYRYFLHQLFNEKKTRDKKRKNKETLEQVLAFNNVLQAKLKEEGRRPFADLTECQKKGNVDL